MLVLLRVDRVNYEGLIDRGLEVTLMADRRLLNRDAVAVIYVNYKIRDNKITICLSGSVTYSVTDVLLRPQWDVLAKVWPEVCSLDFSGESDDLELRRDDLQSGWRRSPRPSSPPGTV